MISLHYTSHTKAYNTIYTACNIVEAIYSFTLTIDQLLRAGSLYSGGIHVFLQHDIVKPHVVMHISLQSSTDAVEPHFTSVFL